MRREGPLCFAVLVLDAGVGVGDGADGADMRLCGGGDGVCGGVDGLGMVCCDEVAFMANDLTIGVDA